MALGFNKGVYQLKTVIRPDGTINRGPDGQPKYMVRDDLCWRGNLIKPTDLLVPVENGNFFYDVNPFPLKVWNTYK